MSTYRLISSDSHIIEPPDLWEKRIDSKFADRAPRLVHQGDTDQWYCDGLPFGVMGANQQAGLRFEEPEKVSLEGSMETVLSGGLDPHAHVKDLDLDGVAGAVLYPSQSLTLYRVPASDVVSAAFGSYNDHIAEFCQPYPNRLKGIAMINVDNVEEGVGELERAAKMGLAGAMIPISPILRYDYPAYERLWATAQELDMPLSLHTGTIRWRPGLEARIQGLGDSVNFSTRDYDIRESISAMIFSGVFERYPQLRVGAVEFEVTWAAYFLQMMDNVYKERPVGRKGRRFQGDTLPSDFFHRNIFVGFQEDQLGIQLRHHIGVDNLQWGSDYPHAESTFPRSREIVERVLEGVPEEEKTKIAGENTAELYHFN